LHTIKLSDLRRVFLSLHFTTLRSPNTLVPPFASPFPLGEKKRKRKALVRCVMCGIALHFVWSQVIPGPYSDQIYATRGVQLVSRLVKLPVRPEVARQIINITLVKVQSISFSTFGSRPIYSCLYRYLKRSRFPLIAHLDQPRVFVRCGNYTRLSP
jgi:hypothetical protein